MPLLLLFHCLLRRRPPALLDPLLTHRVGWDFVYSLLHARTLSNAQLRVNRDDMAMLAMMMSGACRVSSYHDAMRDVWPDQLIAAASPRLVMCWYINIRPACVDLLYGLSRSAEWRGMSMHVCVFVMLC